MSKTFHACRALRWLTGRKTPHTTAILLAGGSGVRMGEGGVTKQMLLLGGTPVVLHTLRAFESCPYIHEIVLVAKRDELDAMRALCEVFAVKKLRAIVAGGSTRQLSALAGFEAIDGKKTKYVAIHDVARCLVTPDMIADVVATAYAEKAAIAACRVTDTVKRAGAGGYIAKTEDRDTLWCAQTPQVFSADLYCAAAYTAMQAKFAATDDAMLCERIGQRVKLVDCGRENIKLTTPADIPAAEAILAARRAKEEEK
jgi:2-C-methyl-D-erythritol 4-phosphate cytidylyltransferase